MATIFEPFGALAAVQLARDVAGRSLGHGTVEFVNAADGQRAMTELQGMDVAGQRLMLTLAPAAEIALPPPPGMAPVVVDDNLADDGEGGWWGPRCCCEEYGVVCCRGACVVG